jgi:hypothetical protein
MRNRLERLRFLSAFVNRGPGECGANSNNAFALCSVAGGNHDNPCVALPGNACRRGLRDRPSYGNRGGPDRRLAPGHWPLAIWLRPQPGLAQQSQQPRIVSRCIVLSVA